MSVQCQEAIELIRRSVVDGSLMILLPQIYADLANAQIYEGDLSGAEKSIEEGFLLNPFEATLWVAQARLKQARGMPQLALASVNYALAIWSDADNQYVELIKARNLVDDLNQAVQ